MKSSLKLKSSLFFSHTIKNDSGIALMMVIGVITVLAFLLADFTFESKLNKIKIYNQQDKIQARLNAEAGLNFAIAKLRLYQEGRNKIEKDESMKNAFPPNDLESIIIQPFIYPLPAPKKGSIIQKNALDEFYKNTIFRGEVSVVYTKIAGFLNPNSLRIANKAPAKPGEDDAALPNDPDETDDEASPANSADNKKAQKPEVIIEKKLAEALQRLIKDKSDNDEEFHGRYSNLDANYLVKELKFYVNNYDQFQDSEKPEIESKFSQKGITPKHAPLTSLDELYLLPSWDDAIVNLIKDRLSVHEVSVISINEITVEDLKIIFPAINNIQIEEFFKYRDGDPDKNIKGEKFKNAEDFKNVVVGQLNIVSDTDYEERIKQLKEAGLTIDTAGKLYKINSRGVYNNAIYNLVAFVDLPIKPAPPKKAPPGGKKDPDDPNEGNPPKDGEQNPDDNKKPDDPKKEKAPPIELLVPRIIEIRLE